MVKRMVKAIGLVTAMGALAACGAAPDESAPTSEETASESQELPACDPETGICGGGGHYYEPYNPYDDGCGVGETRWNSGGNCYANAPCYGASKCTTLYRCPSTGCGTSTNSPTTNSCYGKWAGYYGCALSNGAYGWCRVDWTSQLACFAY